jgi:hypothetical protein
VAKQKTKKLGRTVTVDEIRSGWHVPEYDPVSHSAPSLRRDGAGEYDDFLSQAAVCTDGKLEGHHFRHGKVLYWELPERFLHKLIDFRRRLKEKHVGVRELEAELKRSPAAKRGQKATPRK